MNIGIHIASLFGVGSRKVGTDIVLGFAGIGDKNRYIVWVPLDWDYDERRLPENFKVIRVDAKGFRKILFENVTLRGSLEKNRIELLLACGDTSMIACPVRHFVLVQNAYLAKRIGGLGFHLGSLFYLKLVVMKVYFRAMLRQTERLLVQTEYMQSELTRLYPQFKEDIEVIPSAVEMLDAPTSEGVKNQIAYISGMAPQKNFRLVSEILHEMPNRYCHLRFALTIDSKDYLPFAEQARRCGVLDRIEFYGKLTHQDSLRLMRESRVVTILSLLESFGIPYYEAMALGVPLVTVDAPFAREACGEAALYAQADCGKDFATKIVQLIENEDLRARLRDAGLRKYADACLTRENVAKKFLKSFEKVTARTRGPLLPRGL